MSVVGTIEEVNKAIFLGQYPTRKIILFPKSLALALVIPVVDIYAAPYNLLLRYLTREHLEIIQGLPISPQPNYSLCTALFMWELYRQIEKESKRWLDYALEQLPEIVKQTRSLWLVLKEIPDRQIPKVFELKGKILQYRWIAEQVLQDQQDHYKEINELIKYGTAVVRPETATVPGQTRENVLFEKQIEKMQQGTFGQGSDIFEVR
jgi:hypothetical protein